MKNTYTNSNQLWAAKTLGTIGGFIAILFWGLALLAALTAGYDDTPPDEAEKYFLVNCLLFLTALVGFTAALMTEKFPGWGGFIQLSVGIVSAILVITTSKYLYELIILIPFILFVIGGLLALKFRFLRRTERGKKIR